MFLSSFFELMHPFPKKVVTLQVIIFKQLIENMYIIDNILSFDIISPEGKAKALAERTKARRLEMNLTQEGLSARSGVPLATYRRFERTGKISLDGLLHIAYALDALNDFDQVFAEHKYATLDEALDAYQKNRKRGKRNE